MFNYTESMQKIKAVNVANGWYDKPVNHKTSEMLIVSEIVEALEDVRVQDRPHLFFNEKGKPLGLYSEYADTWIRCLDYLSRLGYYDLPTPNPFKLLEVGPTVPEDLSFFWDLNSILTCPRRPPEQKCVEVIVNLEHHLNRELLIKAIEAKIEYNATRGYRHGGKIV